MKSKFIKILAIFTIMLGLTSFVALPTYAENSICNMPGVSEEVKKASGCPGATDYDLGNSIQDIINRVILVLGIVAVIAIIIGGILYMTSVGDAGKLKKAKDTILYACIGLIICVLSAAIVNFVIGILTRDPTSGEAEGYLMQTIIANLL